MQVVILSERALPDADGLFAAAVEHIGRKLGRAKPLDTSALPPGRADTVAALDAWADGDVDWRGELARYYEDHIPLHLRPSPALNAALRELGGRGVRIGFWSPGPEEAARIVVHHVGLGRRVEATRVGGAAELAGELAAELGAAPADALVVSADAAELAAAAERGVPGATPEELVALASGGTAVST
jgi:phosphoglycolate phosphatase-like HAD superfamily hydrolase